MVALINSESSVSLDRQLNSLEHANLIRLAEAQPELEYIFRHALIQENAYHTLVRADRRRVHRAAGEAMEALYEGRDQPPELPPQLAHHFEQAADDARAVRYYALAGEAAMARYANTEAVALLSRALACAERSAPEAATWQRLFTARGRALELNSLFDDALANYQAMGQRGQALGDRHGALAASVLAGQLHATATPLFDPPEAERLAEARALGDEPAEAKILWNQLNLYRFTQRYQQARECGEQSLAIARRAGLKEQAALDLNDLSHVYVGLGRWPEARSASAAAGSLWREPGSINMLADSLSTTALYSSLFGDLAAALNLSQEAHRLSTSIGNLWGQSNSLSAMAWAYWYMGQPDRAIEVSDECIRLGALAGYLVTQVFDRARLAFIYGELGDTEHGLALGRLALQATEHLGGVGFTTILATMTHIQLLTGGVEQAAAIRAMNKASHEPMTWEIDPIMRAQTELRLAQGDAAGALELARAHLDRLQLVDLKLNIPEAQITLAKVLLQLGRAGEAREHLVDARARAEAMRAPMIQWAVLYALGELEAAQGNHAAAEPLWTEAREIVLGILARTPTPELRALFLARPELRALLGDGASHAAEGQPQAPAQPAL
jgi:tetratricopeptide (TPR) repeat protein